MCYFKASVDGTILHNIFWQQCPRASAWGFQFSSWTSGAQIPLQNLPIFLQIGPQPKSRQLTLLHQLKTGEPNRFGCRVVAIVLISRFWCFSPVNCSINMRLRSPSILPAVPMPCQSINPPLKVIECTWITNTAFIFYVASYFIFVRPAL